MLAYLCKYTPVELLAALGAEPVKLSPEVTNFNKADAELHPNQCSFVKGVLEDFSTEDYDGIILTSCCDSIRRLYDTLRADYPDKFIYMLDLPHSKNDLTVKLYEKELEQLTEAWMLWAKTGKPEASSWQDRLRARLVTEQNEGENSRPSKGKINIGILGARAPKSLDRLLDVPDLHIALDLTCTGLDRKEALFARQKLSESVIRPQETICPSVSESSDASDQLEGAACPDAPKAAPSLLQEYSRLLLGQIPCLRMTDISDRQKLIRKAAESLNGIIYHTVKFCDTYSFEYSRLHETGNLPILKLETDMTAQCEGQIRTRVEAFLEKLRAQAHSQQRKGAADQSEKFMHANDKSAGRSERSMQANDKSAGRSERSMQADGEFAGIRKDAKNMKPEEIRVLGIDSGSTSTNAVIMDGNQKIISWSIVRTGARSADSAEEAKRQVLEKAGIGEEALSRIVSTGYGRVSISFADRNVTEITCHARGARYFDPDVITILDIGGQDSKAIRLTEEGNVADFAMNDKCAAGTGRFLESMARTLEVDISELGPLSLQSKESVTISSMCTVFAESEVISLIAKNIDKADIANGVHHAIAGKAMSLMARVKPAPGYMMTGGVARNEGVVRVLEEKLGQKVFICDQPDIVGAAGAALFALDDMVLAE